MDRRPYDALKTARDNYEDAKHAVDVAKLNLKATGRRLNIAIEEDPTGASELKIGRVGEKAEKAEKTA